MLDELSSLQESDERHEVCNLSFGVKTRDERGGCFVKRTYTFTWGKEFDQWYLSEYKELRSEHGNEWTTSRHAWWHEHEPVDVEVPRSVSDKLAERLNVDSIQFQL